MYVSKQRESENVRFCYIPQGSSTVIVLGQNSKRKMFVLKQMFYNYL